MKEIKLTQGKVALVDDEDFEYLNQWKWHFNVSYARKRNKYGHIKMHSLLIECPNGKLIDHKDRNTLNNQKSNLRVVTHSQNCQNRSNRKRKTSKYKGVSFHHMKNKKGVYTSWVTSIMVDGRRIPLGSFTTEVEAAKAYNDAALKYHKEFAVLNEILK